MPAIIRKLVTILDVTRQEMGREVTPPIRRAIACAVIRNPFAGRYVEDLADLVAQGEELGALLAERAIAALGIPGAQVESFGKAAVVGEAGEITCHGIRYTYYNKGLDAADVPKTPQQGN